MVFSCEGVSGVSSYVAKRATNRLKEVNTILPSAYDFQVLPEVIKKNGQSEEELS
jgi:hypothetical protein